MGSRIHICLFFSSFTLHHFILYLFNFYWLYPSLSGVSVTLPVAIVLRVHIFYRFFIRFVIAFGNVPSLAIGTIFFSLSVVVLSSILFALLTFFFSMSCHSICLVSFCRLCIIECRRCACWVHSIRAVSCHIQAEDSNHRRCFILFSSFCSSLF